AAVAMAARTKASRQRMVVLLLFCSSDISVDLALEELERHRAGAEHRAVEFLRRIALAKRASRPIAQLEDLELAELVRAGLSGKHHVALDLARPDAIGDRLLARPAL